MRELVGKLSGLIHRSPLHRLLAVAPGVCRFALGVSIQTTGRLIFALFVVLLLSQGAFADVRTNPKLRIAAEHRIAAVSGEEYAGVVEFTAPEHGVLDQIELSGEGWDVHSITPSASAALRRGQSVVIRYRAIPTNADEDLTLSIRFGGLETTRVFNVGPDRIGRLGKARKSLRTDGLPTVQLGQIDPNPPPPSNVAGGQTIHIVGRIVFQRQGETNWTGADGIWFRIMDDDSPDPFDEQMYSGYTDVNGYFDVTINWDDCDASGCDEPDIYLHYETDTDNVNVQDSDLLEEDYNWDTSDDPWDDFEGDFIDFGDQSPSDTNEYVPIFIHNNFTRAHRFILSRINLDVEEVDVIWPDGGDTSYYDSFSENIHITSAREWNECTHIHEYGHHFLENYSVNLTPDYCNGYCDGDGNCAAGTCGLLENGGHCTWCPETNHDAWNEGWPGWLASVVMRSMAADYGGYVPLQIADGRCNSEGLGTCCQDNSTAAADITEGYALALLRDIEDSNTQFYCSTSALDCTTSAAVCVAPDTCNNTPDDHDIDGILDCDGDGVAECNIADCTGDGTVDCDCDVDWMSIGVVDIFKVVTDDLPTNPLDFIDKFRARFPHHALDLWYTARNVSTVYANYPQPAPEIISPPQDCSFARVGQPLTITVTSNGFSNKYQWQREGVNLVNDARISGARSNSLTINPLAASDEGLYTVMVTTCDGSQFVPSNPIRVRAFPALGGGTPALMWGRDTAGELGLGTLPPSGSSNYSTPSSVLTVNDFVVVSPGNWHTLGVKGDGTVWAWGSGHYYQLGRASVAPSSVPIQVPGLRDIVDVKPSDYTSFALGADGRVYSWGGNWGHELGRVTPSPIAEVPMAIPNLECVVELNVAAFTMMAIKSDGTVWTWGSNAYGLRGLGYVGNPVPLEPTEVPGITDAVNGTTGWVHSLIVRANGTILGWGSGGHGAVGDGTQVTRTSPVPTVGIDDVRFVADGGGYHSIAVKNDGTAWAWGGNQNGEAGINSTSIYVLSPTQVNFLTNVTHAARTNATTAFRRGDGTFWVTGSNGNGGLGTSTVGSGWNLVTRIPIQLNLLNGATYLNGGGNNTVVLAPFTNVAISQQPVPQANLVGQTASFSVAASGTPQIRYQWKRNNVDVVDGGAIAGARAATLTINPVALNHAGTYTVAVSNAFSAVDSTTALFTVGQRFADFNGDGGVNEVDMVAFERCRSGPGTPPVPVGQDLTPQMCQAIFDLGADGDVDLRDFAEFQNVFDARE